MEKLEELVFLENQVKDVILQDRKSKQNFHEDLKKVFQHVTKSNKYVSEEVTKTITETLKNINKVIENLNNKLLEKMNDRGIIASYLMSPLSKITNPENTSQFKLVKDSSSNRVNGLLIHNSIPITSHDNLLKFRDTGKVFELKGYPLKMITNKNYNVDLAKLSDKKLMYDLAKEMHFGVRAPGKKSTRDRTLIKLLKSTAIIASGVSTKFYHLIPMNFVKD